MGGLGNGTVWPSNSIRDPAHAQSDWQHLLLNNNYDNAQELVTADQAMQIRNTVDSASINTNTRRLKARQVRQAANAQAASSTHPSNHSPAVIIEPAAAADSAKALNSATPSTLPRAPARRAIASWQVGEIWRCMRAVSR
ncbi:hypothetical protein D3C73_1047720 [compost metagenome]